MIVWAVGVAAAMATNNLETHKGPAREVKHFPVYGGFRPNG